MFSTNIHCLQPLYLKGISGFLCMMYVFSTIKWVPPILESTHLQIIITKKNYLMIFLPFWITIPLYCAFTFWPARL